MARSDGSPSRSIRSTAGSAPSTRRRGAPRAPCCPSTTTAGAPSRRAARWRMVPSRQEGHVAGGGEDPARCAPPASAACRPPGAPLPGMASGDHRRAQGRPRAPGRSRPPGPAEEVAGRAPGIAPRWARPARAGALGHAPRRRARPPATRTPVQSAIRSTGESLPRRASRPRWREERPSATRPRVTPEQRLEAFRKIVERSPGRPVRALLAGHGKPRRGSARGGGPGLRGPGAAHPGVRPHLSHVGPDPGDAGPARGGGRRLRTWHRRPPAGGKRSCALRADAGPRARRGAEPGRPAGRERR